MNATDGRTCWAIVLLATVLMGVAPASAATIHVSAVGADTNDGLTWSTAKATVQAGLDAAIAGDQVWVAAGTYVQCITLKTGVALYGGFAGGETDLPQRDWAANVTVLDGTQGGSVVTAPTGAAADTRIDGFVIRNGGSDFGGGIFCDSSSPMIANNTITGNSAKYCGAGIYCYHSSSPMIANNTITGNSANIGGGIYCDSSSSPMIANNIITGNSAFDGGGIRCRSYSSPTIANNTITGNSADVGGGICCLSYSSPTIANNSITGNNASYGGGIYCFSNSIPIVANTIVAWNSSGIYRSEAMPTPQHCCVYGNPDYNYAGLADPTGADGNISADPLFVRMPNAGPDSAWGTADDDYGDLHLLPGSPCIDAGNNADMPADTIDLDGNGNVAEPLPVDLAGGLRFLDDPQVADTGAGTAPIVDMGAYERCRPVGDVDGDWLTDVADLLWLVESFGKSQGDAGFDPRCDFNGDGMVDSGDLLDLVYNFGQ